MKYVNKSKRELKLPKLSNINEKSCFSSKYVTLDKITYRYPKENYMNHKREKYIEIIKKDLDHSNPYNYRGNFKKYKKAGVPAKSGRKNLNEIIDKHSKSTDNINNTDLSTLVTNNHYNENNDMVWAGYHCNQNNHGYKKKK